MKTAFQILILFFLPLTIHAAFWQVVESNDENNTIAKDLAQIQNNDGFKIQIFLDEYSEVKLRFTSSSKVGALSDKICPSFQVDNYTTFNRSFNGDECIVNGNTYEYGLGSIELEHIDSTALYRIQNGNQLFFRYMFENEGYGETSFTLAGSSRIILSVLGSEIVIRKTRP